MNWEQLEKKIKAMTPQERKEKVLIYVSFQDGYFIESKDCVKGGDELPNCGPPISKERWFLPT